MPEQPGGEIRTHGFSPESGDGRVIELPGVLTVNQSVGGRRVVRGAGIVVQPDESGRGAVVKGRVDEPQHAQRTGPVRVAEVRQVVRHCVIHFTMNHPKRSLQDLLQAICGTAARGGDGSRVR